MLFSTTIDELKEIIKDSKIDIKKFDFRYDDFPVKFDRVSYTTYSINLINTSLSFIIYITPNAIINGFRVRINKERAIISKSFPIEPGLEHDPISVSEVRERFEFWISKTVLTYLKNNNLMDYTSSDSGSVKLGLQTNKTVLVPDFKNELLISIQNYCNRYNIPYQKDDYGIKIHPILFWDDESKKYFGQHSLKYKLGPMSFNILIDENSNQNFKVTYTFFNSNFSERKTEKEIKFKEVTQLFNEWLNNELKHYVRHKTLPDPFSDITNSDLFNAEKEDEILNQNEIIQLNQKLLEIKAYVSQEVPSNDSTAIILYDDHLQNEKINKDVDELIEIIETKDLPRKHLAHLIKSTFDNWSVNEKYESLWDLFVKWISN